MSHTVFVYGTLRQGFGNHRLLTGSKFLGHGSAYGLKLFDVGAFPAAVKAHKSAIHGELYEVDETTLARLDRLEGVPYLYRRETVQCDLDEESDAEIVAHIYIWNRETDRLTPIPCGDYKQYREAKRHYLVTFPDGTITKFTNKHYHSAITGHEFNKSHTAKYPNGYSPQDYLDALAQAELYEE